MTWNPVRTTEDGTIPEKHDQKEIVLHSEDVQMTGDAGETQRSLRVCCPE